MKLQIKFFADLYDFLIKDYPLQFNEKNKIILPYFLFKNTAEVNFILQNIHILDSPTFNISSVNAIKIILKFYLQESDNLQIHIPKFEYHVRYDILSGQNIVEKILQPPIKESNYSYILFKNYTLQELKTLLDENRDRLFLNPTYSEFVKILNFINQFFCISHSKINYCIFDFANNLLTRNFDKEYLEIFLNNEIDIELNYPEQITVYDRNLNSFISSPQVSYNRFLVLYHEALNNFDLQTLNTLFNICNHDNLVIKSLISAASLPDLEKNIITVINIYKSITPSETYIHFIISYREEFLNSYYDLLKKLNIKHSDLLIHVCNNDNELIKLLISRANPLSFNERYNIIKTVINKYDHNPELIPHLITQLLNVLAYEKVKTNHKMKMDINSYLEHLSKYCNILPINWCYPDGKPFEDSKYCKLLGDEQYF